MGQVGGGRLGGWEQRGRQGLGGGRAEQRKGKMRVGAELRCGVILSASSEDRPGCSVGGRGGLGSFRSEVMGALVQVG